jgi:LysM repeat protein
MGTLLAGGEPAHNRYITVTTSYAEIKLVGTTAMIAYHPESELTLVRGFDGQLKVRNLVGVGRDEFVDPQEWALVAPDRPPQVSARLEDMRELARDLGLWDAFHEVEVDVAEGFGPTESRVPSEKVDIVFVGEPPPTVTVTPPPTATPVPCIIRPPANWQQYSVSPGETLYSLSRRHGTSVQMIKQVNCLVGDAIGAGQRLWLPYRPPTPVPCVPRPPSGWVQYVVQRGDTLYSLARLRQTTVSQIVLVNCLASDGLYVGQVLWLPYEEPTPVPCKPSTDGWPYVVQEGDTLEALAWRFGVTVEAIWIHNCLTSATLYAEQVLWIPYEGRESESCGCTGGWVQHVVQPGENLYRLSLRYCVSQQAIVTANGLVYPEITPGQILRIPCRAP